MNAEKQLNSQAAVLDNLLYAVIVLLHARSVTARVYVASFKG